MSRLILFGQSREVFDSPALVTPPCITGHFPLPFFLVVRTGNYVMELKNVGSFESTFLNTNQASSKTNLLKIIELCNKHKIRVKEHNTDYLSDRALQLHPEIGIHAANIAPEFAVAETMALLSLLKKHQLERELEIQMWL